MDDRRGDGKCMMPYYTPEQINQFFPVIGIRVYNGGVIVKRGCTLNLNQRNYAHERKKITLVSKRSLAKLALLVRGCGITFQSLMTLSYGANYPFSGRIAKRHLNHFLVASKRAFGHYEHIWVLEFQERGAVHFHIATTLPEPNVVQKEIFARIWQEISTPYSWMYCQLDNDGKRFFEGQTLLTDQAVFTHHCSEKAWEKVRKGDSLSHYFAKYTMKIRQKKVPSYYSDVGRFWAASQGVKLPDGENFHGSEENVRLALTLQGRDVKKWDVLPKIVLVG